MKGSLHSYMKVGVVLGMSFPDAAQGGEPFLKALEKVAEDDFFSMVEIGRVKQESIRKRALQLISLSRLEVGFSGAATLIQGNYDLNHFEEAKRREAVQVAMACYDEAREMGAQVFSLISGRNPPDGRDEAIRRLIQSLREIGAYARSRGEIPIVLETFDCEIDKCCLVGPSSDALKVAEEITKQYPQFSLMVDLSHLPLLHEEPRESLRILRGYIGHIHLGNCVLADKEHPAYGDTHPPFGIPGGATDVQEVADFLKALFEIGYLGENRRRQVSLEVKPGAVDEADAVLAGSKRVLLEAWAQI